MVATAVKNIIPAKTNSNPFLKHTSKVLCPINAPIDANNALMMIVDTTQKATGRTTISSTFPMYFNMFMNQRREKNPLGFFFNFNQLSAFLRFM